MEKTTRSQNYGLLLTIIILIRHLRRLTRSRSISAILPPIVCLTRQQFFAGSIQTCRKFVTRLRCFRVMRTTSTASRWTSTFTSWWRNSPFETNSVSATFCSIFVFGEIKRWKAKLRSGQGGSTGPRWWARVSWFVVSCFWLIRLKLRLCIWDQNFYLLAPSAPHSQLHLKINIGLIMR